MPRKKEQKPLWKQAINQAIHQLGLLMPLSLKTRKIEVEYNNMNFHLFVKRNAQNPLSFYHTSPWNDYERTGCHEPVTTQKFIDLLRGEEQVVWDVGSAHGYFSVLAGHLTGKPGNVHCFEPDLESVQVIQKNNQAYFEGQMQVNTGFLTDHKGANRMTGDSYCNSKTSPDLIKIDVDGGERGVLEGSTSVLQTANPDLLLEIHTESINPDYHQDIECIQTLLDRNYSNIQICLNHRQNQVKWRRVESLQMLINISENDYMLYCPST